MTCGMWLTTTLMLDLVYCIDSLLSSDHFLTSADSTCAFRCAGNIVMPNGCTTSECSWVGKPPLFLPVVSFRLVEPTVRHIPSFPLISCSLLQGLNTRAAKHLVFDFVEVQPQPQPLLVKPGWLNPSEGGLCLIKHLLGELTF